MKNLFEKILFHAIQKNATDIHLYLQDTFTITFRIYGNIQYYKTISNEEGERLINFIKYKAHMNTNHKLANSTGEFNITINDNTYNLRISSLPTKNMKSIVIRILYPDNILDIKELTPQLDLIDYLRQIMSNRFGLFIISGPTGSGKSTTLYSLISLLNQTFHYNIISVEDPIEMYLKDCLQIELNDDLGITYISSLKQILRHDPDVIVIGEIRDEQTAKIAITCALTGHLVLTTIHSSNVQLTIQRLLNLNVNTFELQSVILGILSQRLIHDEIHQKTFMIGEYCNKMNVYSYLNNKVIDYLLFKDIINTLIKKGFHQDLFKTLS